MMRKRREDAASLRNNCRGEGFPRRGGGALERRAARVSGTRMRGCERNTGGEGKGYCASERESKHSLFVVMCSVRFSGKFWRMNVSIKKVK